jgi:hypothetical protein
MAISKTNPQTIFSVFSVPSVLLILKFVAPGAEFLNRLGGPGFSPAEPKFPSVGFTGCGKSLKFCGSCLQARHEV